MVKIPAVEDVTRWNKESKTPVKSPWTNRKHLFLAPATSTAGYLTPHGRHLPHSTQRPRLRGSYSSDGSMHGLTLAAERETKV